MSNKILCKKFYERDTDLVARKLLGKRLIRKLGETSLEGIIVETEAYLGLEDPASRAYQGIKKFNKPMFHESGRAFIYNVHKYWLFNIVAHKPNQVGAVLIRAIEPINGIEVMKKNRSVKNIVNLTNGPGKLAIALKINKSLNRVPITSPKSEIFVSDNETNLEIGMSFRIGVQKDMLKKLRFFVKGNKFVTGEKNS